MGGNTTLVACGYSRVSTNGQEVGLSLDTQQDKIGNEILNRGWEMALFTDTASAKSLQRPGLTMALEMLSTGQAGALVVARLDRLSRSVPDFYKVLDLAKREGWALICLDPKIDMTDPFGRAMAGMAAVFAQLERELIGQRQRESIAARRAAGTYSNGAPPVSPTAETHILTLHTRGYGLREIARRLTLQGVEAPGGGVWNHKTVGRVLRRRGREINQRERT